MNSFTITQIKEDERGQLIDLLKEANLPFTDLPKTLDHFFLAKKDEKVIGSIGLELFLPYALLRSMVVTKGMQGEGIGKLLLNHLLLHVSNKAVGIKEIYLITEGAQKFFKSAGFEAIGREHLPEAFKEIPQFKTLCPASASVMKSEIK